MRVAHREFTGGVTNKILQDRAQKDTSSSVNGAATIRNRFFRTALDRGCLVIDARSRGTLHWIAVRHGVKAGVRPCDRLFFKEDPEEDNVVDFKDNLNPDSLPVLRPAHAASFPLTACRLTGCAT